MLFNSPHLSAVKSILRLMKLSRYELNSTCSVDVSCLIKGAVSGYIEPVQWWYQLINNGDNDDNNDNIQR